MNGFDQLSNEAEKFLNLKLSENQAESLVHYAELLVEWNQKISLTAIRSAEEIRIKHLLDSLSCHLAIESSPSGRLIDVGTGAGFPGIPLKILYPEMGLVLVESVHKKTLFLSHVVQELGLSEVEILTERAEVIGQQADHREKYQWAAARAVAALPVLSEYLLPLVEVGGYMLAQKGESASMEIAQAQAALEELGGEIVECIPVELPGDLPDRYLVVIKKVHPTPDKYPRRSGIPGKRPLKS